MLLKTRAMCSVSCGVMLCVYEQGSRPPLLREPCSVWLEGPTMSGRLINWAPMMTYGNRFGRDTVWQESEDSIVPKSTGAWAQQWRQMCLKKIGNLKFPLLINNFLKAFCHNVLFQMGNRQTDRSHSQISPFYVTEQDHTCNNLPAK